MGERHAKSGVVSASVLIVGNPALPLKGFDVAIKALAAVNRVLPIQLTWVCQTQPTAASVPALVGSGLTIDLLRQSLAGTNPCARQSYPPAQPATSQLVLSLSAHACSSALQTVCDHVPDPDATANSKGLTERPEHGCQNFAG